MQRKNASEVFCIVSEKCINIYNLFLKNDDYKNSIRKQL